MSDDGAHGITVIAMLGAVFSPYYARARRRGPRDPLEHSALNVALYGAGPHRWSLTERGRRAVTRSAERLVIGPSSLAWEGDELVVRIEEIAAPLPRRIRGELRLRPAAIGSRRFDLDVEGRHHWYPIAPCARIAVDLARPRLRWEGPAYLDGNAGETALELDFRRWHWSRSIGEDATTVLYDVERRRGGPLALALRFDAGGGLTALDAPQLVALPRTGWRIERATRSDAGSAPGVRSTLEDTPFYARSVVTSRLQGAELVSMHESLSLERFDRGWVQTLIPFRMPRVFW